MRFLLSPSGFKPPARVCVCVKSCKWLWFVCWLQSRRFLQSGGLFSAQSCDQDTPYGSRMYPSSPQQLLCAHRLEQFRDAAPLTSGLLLRLHQTLNCGAKWNQDVMKEEVRRLVKTVMFNMKHMKQQRGNDPVHRLTDT